MTIGTDELLCTPLLRFGIARWWLSEVVKLVSQSHTLFRNAASGLLFSRKIGLAMHGTSSVGTAFA